MEKNRKSVSYLLDKAFGEKIQQGEGKRGNIMHEAYARFLKNIFKTASRYNKTSYIIFSQRLTKVKTDILADIRKNSDSELYHEDVKILLNAMLNSIRGVAKISFEQRFQQPR